MKNLMKNNQFINTRIFNAGVSPILPLIFINAGVNSLIFGQDALGT
jgi:hypothetical protein